VTLSHLDGKGRARMVDVGGKPETKRLARASGTIRMSAEAFALVERNSGPKGDVMSTAELAGVMAAKRTAELIPLCHPVALDHVRVSAGLEPALPGVRVEATAEATGNRRQCGTADSLRYGQGSRARPRSGTDSAPGKVRGRFGQLDQNRRAIA
jgi:molybdenum cofactor biosynthesis protein MoaC